MSNNLKWALAFIGLIIFGFSLYNASWIADEPKGEIALIGHGNWPLPVDKQECIIDPRVAYNDIAYNADVRSLRTIAAHDADGVKFDTELSNGKILIQRPPKTNCTTDLNRPRSSINDAITAMSALEIFTEIKAGEDDKADALIAAFKGKTYPKTVWVFGDDDLSKKISAAAGVKALPISEARQCITDYKVSGWYGSIPDSCDQGSAIITLDDGFALWGWPNRLMARFAENGIHIFIAKDIVDGEIVGLDDVNSYGDIPDSFVGSIWIEDIENLGPALIR